MDTSPEFKCDRCGHGLSFDEVGYFGAVDPADTACSPFTQLLCLCMACAAKDPRYRPLGSATPKPPEKN